MKKQIVVLGLVLAALAVGAQQIIPQTNVVTQITFPATTWTNTDAIVIAQQLASITNSAGERIVPGGFLTDRSSTIAVQINCAHGRIKSISAKVSANGHGPDKWR